MRALGFVLIDAAGVIAATATQESRAGHYAFSAVVPEGRYTLRAAAIDTMGRQGSVERSFLARLGGTGGLRVGDLMLAPVPATPRCPVVAARRSRDRRCGRGVPRVPNRPGRRRARGAHGDRAGPSDPPLVSAVATVSSGADGWVTAQAVLPIAGLASGSYLARAEIDVAGATTGRIARPFTIGGR